MPSILYVDEDPQGLTSSIDEDWRRSYTRRFNVATSPDAGPAFVRNNLTLPGGVSPIAVGQSWSYANGGTTEIDPGALVLDVEVRCTGQIGANPATGVAVAGALWWTADVRLGPWNPIDHTATGSPTAQPPRISVEFVNEEQVVTKDIIGSPVLNTAGDPFDPPVVRDRCRCLIRITENVSASNMAAELGYVNQINSDTWLGFPPRTVKVEPPRFGQAYSQEADLVYWERERIFSYNPDGWDKRILNCGYNEIKATTSGGTTTYQKTTIKGNDGESVMSPQPLDIDGASIPPPYNLDSEADPATDYDIGPSNATDDGAPTPPSSPSPVVFLEFQVYYAMDFTSTFGYPPSLLD